MRKIGDIFELHYQNVAIKLDCGIQKYWRGTGKQGETVKNC